MRVVTPQITWHNRDPVLCVDFDPSTCKDDAEHNFYRLATGGSDSHLLIWHLKNPASIKVEIACVADLSRHTKAINTLRFSPCGKFLASADDDAYVYIWKNDGDKAKPDEEFWTVEKALRKHIDDVSDMSWSSDSARLVTSSVDNSAILWDVKKGVPIHILSDHVGFVQGVSTDPLGEFVATMSTDRLLRIFNPQTGKLKSKTLKYPANWLSKEKKSAVKEPSVSTDENQSGQPKKSTPPPCNRIFHDDTLKSYCRRLNFSPKGEFLVVPGGILPPNQREDGEKVTTDGKSVESGARNSKKINNSKEKPLSDRNAVIVFCRNSFTKPCSVIPTGVSYSIAARFCPLYFQRNRDLITYDKELVNPTKKSERLVTCVGKLKEAKRGKKPLLDMPYRLVFAVGTNDSLIISDTESVVPLAVVRNIHLTRLSDLSWSPDGRVLVASSTDGYCSIISFEDKELGIPVTAEILPVSHQAFPIPLPPVKEKTPKPTKKRPGKDSVDKESKELKKPDTPTTPSTKKKEPGVRKTPTKDKDIAQFFKGKNSAAKPKPKVQILEDKKIETDDIIVLDAPIPIEENGAGALPPSQNGNSEETETEKEKIAITPKRSTFLERWLKKTDGGSKDSVASSSNTSPEGNEPQISMPPPNICSPLKRLDVGLSYSLPGLSPSRDPNSTVLRPMISPEQIHQLQNAPIIIDLEADEAENAASVILSSNDDLAENLMKVVGKPSSINGEGKHATPNNHQVKAPSNPISTSSIIREKRPATSPLSSQQKPKQPRRVEFITLPKSPRKDE